MLASLAIKVPMEELELEQPASFAEPGQTYVITPEGHARLQEELKRLSVDKRAEIAQRIRDSKDHGEFSEDNNELDEVKLEQAMVESRINELKTVLAGAEILDKSMIPTDRVGVGSRVSVKDAERGIEFEIRLVSTIEADPDNDLISEESPMGQALMGLAVGENATFEAPLGKITYAITKIRK